MSLLLDYLALYFTGYAYLGFFLLLAFGGLGLPIPEELSLVAAGLFVSWGTMDLAPTLVVCGVGMLIGDLLFFAIGRAFGQRSFKGLLRRLAPEDRIERTMTRLHKYGMVTVFFGRYLTGIRPAVFLGAGAMRMPIARFILFDGLSAITSLALWVFIGHNFSAEIEVILHRIGQFEEAILAIVAAIVLVIAIEKTLLHIHKLHPSSRPVRAIQAARIPIVVLTAVFALLLARQHAHTARARLAANVAAGIPSPIKSPGMLLDMLPSLLPAGEPVDVLIVSPRELLESALLETGYRLDRLPSAILFDHPPTLCAFDERKPSTHIALWRSPFTHADNPVWMGRVIGDKPSAEVSELSARLVRAGYTQRVSAGPRARPPGGDRIVLAVLRPQSAQLRQRASPSPASGYNHPK